MSWNPQVVVAHTGARMHYAVAVLLNRSGLLAQLFTDAYCGDGSWLSGVVRPIPRPLLSGALRRLEQRRADLPAHKVTALNLLGFRYAWALRRPASSRTYVTDMHLKYNRELLEGVARSKTLARSTAVYGFCGAALELLEAAKVHGQVCILEQMIAPVIERAPLLDGESQRWPGWQVTDVMGWDEVVWTRREALEWQLADRIVAPSEYVRSTLVSAGVSSDKITVMPYAVPLDRYGGSERSFAGNRPLRVLFVGTVGLRKGVPYLLEALRELGPGAVEARLIGLVTLDPSKLEDFGEVATFTGMVSRHEVAEHYRWADLFVLPSLCEGSATVTYEARACGLPVVATPNAGAWIADGEDGLVVPARDAHAIADVLRQFLKRPQLLPAMSRTALANASNFSWDQYQRRLVSLVTG